MPVLPTLSTREFSRGGANGGRFFLTSRVGGMGSRMRPTCRNSTAISGTRLQCYGLVSSV